jgi:hypothetical protein
MAQLSSPGVSVTVIDESFYTPAAAGTTPLIVVASAQDKSNGSGTGTAPGTLKANAGQVYLLTSQKDLADTFGTPIFKTDASNNPVHAGELNEYGLQAAYSFLGVSNRVYAVRADVDLAELEASASAPTGPASNGTYWVDTATTSFGIFEWNSSLATTTGGQTFTVRTPIVITDKTKVVNFAGQDYTPKKSVGAIGDYAVVAVTSLFKLWFKNQAGTWVEVGSTGGNGLPYTSWTNSWPIAVSTGSVTTAIANSVGFTTTTDDGSPQSHTYAGGADLDAFASFINTGDGGDPLVPGLSAKVVSGKLQYFSDGTFGKIVFGGSLFGSSGWNGVGGSTKPYYTPIITIQPHTQVPTYKRGDTDAITEDVSPLGRPTGSIWIKTTEPNAGAKWRIKRFNSATAAWESSTAPLYKDNAEALYGLDKAGGGVNLAQGTLYVKFNDSEESPNLANFKVYRRTGVDSTKIVSAVFTDSTLDAGTYTIFIAETLKGQSTIGAVHEIEFTVDGFAVSSGEAVAGEINAAGLTNVVADFDSVTRKLSIYHKLAGDFRLAEGAGNPLAAMGFVAGTTANLYATPVGDMDYEMVASLWAPLSAVNSDSAPSSLPADGRLWYNSMIDEVDMMIHDGSKWVGYLTSTSPYYNSSVADQTDPMGPIVSATAPIEQSDGTDLKEGDLWISTADLENFPLIHRWNNDTKKWVLLDKTDQTTENGVLFHDARWTADGIDATSEASSIEELLISNYVDPDCPDPALYPKGMLLWNLRRSGFNVKEFKENYIDTTASNPRVGLGDGEAMSDYYPHRWVSVAANNEDGSGAFGRFAQRKVVIQGLQALVNANQQIRDEEARIFNLIACPGYPELIGELVSLNYDRGLTAFVVGDTPARLKSDATTLNNWGTNQALVLEDNDKGLVSSDEYLGIFYPWGYTSDNLGNNVVVPPSHMMLRTIALSDNVSYPWFAPAGTRRGGITNATAVGYVDPTSGEFQSVALNTGQRDTLAGIKVNPITFITGTGLVNYGQYTRAKNASALDRINVARLVVYLRRQLSLLAKPYVFEPNDKITRDEIKQAAESLMLELVGQRALYDYIVVCDTSNNTPSRIDRNELYLDIAIEPVKAVEFIYIPLRLKNTGEIKGLG